MDFRTLVEAAALPLVVAAFVVVVAVAVAVVGVIKAHEAATNV